jgi:hypothetical protein
MEWFTNQFLRRICMQFRLGVMKMVEPSVEKLLKEDLPIRISYRISKFHDNVIKELNRIENLRQQLVRRYGAEVENVIRVTEENMSEFNREYEELLNETIDIDFEPIPVKQIIDFSERLEMMGKPAISISAFDIHQLESIGLLEE